MDKTDCNGCYSDFYNSGEKHCWHFESSKKLVKKYVIHRDQMPPFGAHLIRKVPPCYQPQNYCVVDPENITPAGYWS